MLAGKVKDGTDKLGITVNVELNLHLCFVASCAFERNDTYVHRRALNISDHNGVSELVLSFFPANVHHHAGTLHGTAIWR